MKNIKTLEEVNVPKTKVSEIKFSELGISASILGVLKNLKLEVPTPIQHQAIPPALNGQDIIGIAQTGTGKTLAYGIPILQRLGLEKGKGLVVVPTRELAIQVTESLKKLGNSLGLRLATLIGGEFIDRQLFMLRKNPHIIVATPGRLIDHLKRKTVKLDEVKILVLDEADMMLDLGFAPQVEEIMKQTPKNKQTMLFSATMPASIAKLAATHLRLPINIEVAPQGTTVEKVEQEVFVIKPTERFSHLEKIIKEHNGSILVFVRTKRGVTEVTQKLINLGHKATEIHSNLSLNRRRAALDSFKSLKARILVATDVAARGLDINGIELVVNYNLPDASSDYVHRIGRTGRAGKIGKAISLATPNQLKDIRDIERLINKSLTIKEFTKFEQTSGRSFSKGGSSFGRSFGSNNRNNNQTPKRYGSNDANSKFRISKSGQGQERTQGQQSRQKFNGNRDRNRFFARKKPIVK
jgi:superfamily II DNA/RNA helicase